MGLRIYRRLKRRKILVIVVIIILLFVLYFFRNGTDSNVILEKYYSEELLSLKINPKNFLINTTNCRIPESDPFGKDIIRFIEKKEYANCTKLKLLSYIEKHFTIVTLNINTSLIPQYSWTRITCCYSEIHRVDDNKISFTTCKPFEKSVSVDHMFIKVTCRNAFFMTVYENVHSAIIPDRIFNFNNDLDQLQFSILFVGIDCMSKQNLRRTMPKSYEHLEKNFINLRGYNKIEDNTYPNIMAILTGENITQLDESCPFYINKLEDELKDKNFLSKCSFIWRHFSRFGYVTAFGEDSSPLGTFHYAKKGFPEPPTDYYYRPYFLAAEELKSSKNHCHPLYCTGPETSGERTLNIIKDFSVTMKDRPSFGFFWMNSFSHDNYNCPSTMDEKILNFLNDPEFVESLRSTILVFYSDHGFRFGGIRQTHSGWLEERLPFIYLRVPKQFQRRFPKEYQNILTNSHRLTTPYDLHNTLHHLLKLQDNSYDFIPSPGCDKCQSLMEEIPETRTCKDAGIAMHWCTCTDYSYMNTEKPLVEEAASFIVQEINKLVVLSFPEGNKCTLYSLDRILSAAKSSVRFEEGKKVFYLLVMLVAKPKTVFEATVQVSVYIPRNFKIMGSVSRTDFYGDHIFCIQNPILQKYCYCEDIITVLKGKVCRRLNLC